MIKLPAKDEKIFRDLENIYKNSDHIDDINNAINLICPDPSYREIYSSVWNSMNERGVILTIDEPDHQRLLAIPLLAKNPERLKELSTDELIGYADLLSNIYKAKNEVIDAENQAIKIGQFTVELLGFAPRCAIPAYVLCKLGDVLIARNNQGKNSGLTSSDMENLFSSVSDTTGKKKLICKLITLDAELEAKKYLSNQLKVLGYSQQEDINKDYVKLIEEFGEEFALLIEENNAITRENQAMLQSVTHYIQEEKKEKLARMQEEAKLKERQQKLANFKSSFEMLALCAYVGDQQQLATDISTFGQASMTIASAAYQFVDILEVGASLALLGPVVGVGKTILGLLDYFKNRSKEDADPFLNGIQKLSVQIDQLHKVISNRFDRIEMMLCKLHYDTLIRFSQLQHDIAKINTNLESMRHEFDERFTDIENLLYGISEKQDVYHQRLIETIMKLSINAIENTLGLIDVFSPDVACMHEKRVSLAAEVYNILLQTAKQDLLTGNSVNPLDFNAIKSELSLLNYEFTKDIDTLPVAFFVNLLKNYANQYLLKQNHKEKLINHNIWLRGSAVLLKFFEICEKEKGQLLLSSKEIENTQQAIEEGNALLKFASSLRKEEVLKSLIASYKQDLERLRNEYKIMLSKRQADLTQAYQERVLVERTEEINLASQSWEFKHGTAYLCDYLTNHYNNRYGVRASALGRIYDAQKESSFPEFGLPPWICLTEYLMYPYFNNKKEERSPEINLSINYVISFYVTGAYSSHEECSYIPQQEYTKLFNLIANQFLGTPVIDYINKRKLGFGAYKTALLERLQQRVLSIKHLKILIFETYDLIYEDISSGLLISNLSPLMLGLPQKSILSKEKLEIALTAEALNTGKVVFQYNFDLNKSIMGLDVFLAISEMGQQKDFLLSSWQSTNLAICSYYGNDEIILYYWKGGDFSTKADSFHFTFKSPIPESSQSDCTKKTDYVKVPRFDVIANHAGAEETFPENFIETIQDKHQLADIESLRTLNENKFKELRLDFYKKIKKECKQGKLFKIIEAVDAKFLVLKYFSALVMCDFLTNQYNKLSLFVRNPYLIKNSKDIETHIDSYAGDLNDLNAQINKTLEELTDLENNLKSLEGYCEVPSLLLPMYSTMNSLSGLLKKYQSSPSSTPTPKGSDKLFIFCDGENCHPESDDDVFHFKTRKLMSLPEENLQGEDASNRFSIAPFYSSSKDGHNFAVPLFTWSLDQKIEIIGNKAIFTVYYHKDNERIGYMRLFGRPEFCRSRSGNRHNVIELGGILSGHEGELQPEEAGIICDSLPPLAHSFTESAINAGINGSLLGGCNVLEKSLKKYTSFQYAEVASKGIYYTSLLGMSFWRHYNEISEVKEPGIACYEAAVCAMTETTAIAAIQLAAKGLNRIGKAFEDRQCPHFASFFKGTSKLFNATRYIVPFVNPLQQPDWQSKSIALAETGTLMTIGTAAQVTTETIGRKVMRL